MRWTNDHLAHDWFPRDLPRNLEFGRNVYIESSYVFAAFFSELEPALIMEEGSGAYDLTAIITGRSGRITIGAYSCLNSTTLICEQAITIGAHCLFAWGSVVTDATIPAAKDSQRRHQAMAEIGMDPLRRLRPMADVKPVTIGSNAWIGFDSVIAGGVEVGRGAIVGCKTLVTENIPPYAIAVGNPCRVVRVLEPDDTEEARAAALHEFGILPIEKRA